MVKDISDEVLANRIQKGDEKAFEEIVKRYEGKVYNLAYRINQNREDASDILQDTFIQVYKKISTFRGDSKLSTWIYRIATNAALMKKRKDSKNQSYSIETPILTGSGDELKRQLKADWSVNLLDELENRELHDRLDIAIEQLHIDYRIPLILRDINGLSNEEVSQILDISITAVKSRVHRARLFLRESLGEYFQSEGMQDGF
ncbi:MAG: sigma-70 family RNA polymerase sigma factor [Elusimicrobiota bacterium]